MSETYSPEVQAYLDKKKKEVNNIPELQFSRIRLNGKTGEWLESVPDTENEGKFKNVPMAQPDGTPVSESFGAVILRIAFFYEHKGDWRPDGKGGMKNMSKINRRTREFENFRDEQIELLDFSEGKTTTLKTFADQPAFKAYSTPKDEEGNLGAPMYAMKAALYVYHLSLGRLYKLIVSGSSIAEVFEYRNQKKSTNGTITIPWKLAFENAIDISQIKTVFTKHEHDAPNGGKAYFVSFKAVGVCSDEEMKAVIDQNDKIFAWVEGWKAAQKKVDPTLAPKSSMEEKLSEAGLVAPEDDGYVPPQEEEIRMEDIPF